MRIRLDRILSPAKIAASIALEFAIQILSSPWRRDQWNRRPHHPRKRKEP